MELIVEQNGKDFSLDKLGPGSVIGSYSIINESEYQYMAKASSNLSLLILERADLLMAAEVSD